MWAEALVTSFLGSPIRVSPQSKASRRLLLCLLLIASMSIAAVFAQTARPPVSASPVAEGAGVDEGCSPVPAGGATDIVDLDTMVVSGVQPGPGLWKVTAGNGHELWVLGTLAPLPRGMQWDSRRVAEVVAASQEVLFAPSVSIDTDSGFFGNLTLIPGALKARRNPDGKRLQDVVPADQYARWQVLKARYIGGDRGIEQWRPVFAALELYEKAIRKAGLRTGGVVGPEVTRLAKQHTIKTTNPVVKITIARPREALKEFATTTLDDGDCFARTLDRIETDLGTMRARANAWAIGDVQTLRELPYGNQFTACSAAFGSGALARKHGIADMAGQMERKWLAEAERALAGNASTFATLPIAELLKPNGYLAKLEAKGYVVEAP